MTKKQVRDSLKKWAGVEETCKRAQDEIEGFEAYIEELRGIKGRVMDGMPKGTQTGSPTERAALAITEVMEEWGQAIKKISARIEKELAFKQAVDEALAELTEEEQKVITLRYKGRCSWVAIGLKIYGSEGTARRREGTAIKKLSRFAQF